MLPMFASHPKSALEISFFKANAGPDRALLVDWIEDRARGATLIRASYHAPENRGVIMTEDAGNCGLSRTRTWGKAGPVEWKLDITLGPETLHPGIRVVEALRPLDMTLVSRPRARFNGWMTVDGRRHDFEAAPGMLSNYWGRRRPSEWWWVSANSFNGRALAVEAMVLRSGLWGTRFSVSMGYLYLRTPFRTVRLVAPPARHEVLGTEDAFELLFSRRCAPPFRLICRGRDYNDWGDRIINTLVGDLEIREGDQLIARTEGAAGLERRFPPPEGER